MTKREELARLNEQLAELDESLERSGKRRNGTAWQAARVKARAKIQRRIDDLEDIPPVPSYGRDLED